MRFQKVFSAFLMLVMLTFALGVGQVSAAPAQSSGVTTVSLAGTSAPQTGSFTASGNQDVTQAEFPGQIDEPNGAPGPYPGIIVDRSLSNGVGKGVSVNSGKKAKSNPVFQSGFEGLNLYQQRYARGGNQFTVEPPDQALCVGNGYVVEAVNDVLNVFNMSGQSVLPDNTSGNLVSGYARDVNHAVDLNSFYGYAPAINRTTGVRAEFVTDPSCLYDASTQRFFMVVLTLDTYPNGAFTLNNHIDIAVSQTSDPTGQWNIYKLDVTNDGSNPDPNNACPCLGDYPHIGADANGFYVTTNAYPWLGYGFDGAQIYAFSKKQLAAGAADVNMVHIDTFGLVNVPSDAGDTQPGFTLWPAQSPIPTSGATEYFLSSNAAAEATHPVSGANGSYTSDQLVVWSLSNTASLNLKTPNLKLSNKVISVEQYALPPKAKQPGSGSVPDTSVPQGYCLNDTTTETIGGTGCAKSLLLGVNDPFTEVVSTPDANDTRMQQVMYANGRLWGALDTALNPDNGPQRAGIAWFIINPITSTLVKQGFLGASGYDFTYPAIGVTASGRGIMAFTASGDSLNPSAAYAPIDAIAGVGSWSVVEGGHGEAVDDGFTSYKAQVGNPPRTRWGDYGAAAVDGNSIWIASEYIAASCNYTTWGGPFFVGGSGDNLLGSCAPSIGAAGPRTALGNWSTYISHFVP